MKLLYLYIEDHNCIKDQEFNFDSNYHFHLEKKNPQEWELIEDKVENPLPEDFWASSDGKHNVVESVSAIVGNNGSGKTSLANFLGDYIGFRGIDKKYLVIFKILTDTTYHYSSNLVRLKKLSDIKYKRVPLGKTLSFIYFSPFFTTEHIIKANRSVDISTSYLSSLENYKSDEYKKALIYLNEYNKKVEPVEESDENKNKRKIDITLPKPRKIIITIRTGKIQDFINGFRKGKKGDILYNHINDIILNTGNKPSREFNDEIKKYLFMENRAKLTKRELIILLKPLFSWTKRNIFLSSFLCYIILFWKQYIGQQKDRNSFDLKFGDINKTAYDIVKENLYAIAKALLDTSSQNKYEEIIELLKNNHDIALPFFESLKDFLNNKNIYVNKENKDINGEKNKDIKIEILFSKFEETKEELLKFIVDYNEIKLKDDFIIFDIDPKMSSGEMSFLTIYSRIFDCINNNKAKDKKEIILFLDEVETTLHPEWQRKLVSQIITFLEEFAEGKKVHVIFASHSPILLSDIPNTNVVFLTKDSNGHCKTVEPQDIGQTFGSNIYTLYKNSFFMDDGLIGEFADSKINSIIKDFLLLKLDEGINNKDEKYKELEHKIELIGEPVIRNQLKTHLDLMKRSGK
jgi:predicted ATPase